MLETVIEGHIFLNHHGEVARRRYHGEQVANLQVEYTSLTGKAYVYSVKGGLGRK